MSAILEIQGISKAFGGLQALRDFDLQVGEKDLIGIIGPNGAGKTTVFNLITGFIRPDSGRSRAERREHHPPQAFPDREPGVVPHLSTGGPFQGDDRPGERDDPLFLPPGQRPENQGRKALEDRHEIPRGRGPGQPVQRKSQKSGLRGIAPAGHRPGHGHSTRHSSSG